MITAGGRSSLRIATIATETPMGAQVYQERIAERAASALASESAREWSVRRAIVRSMRSDLPGNRRLPLNAVATASPFVRRQVGRVLFRGDTVTHRMNLELPPGPGADVITIHDVVAWRFDDESPPVPSAAEEAKRAAAVICVSEFSANEAIELLGIRSPYVVHNGVDDAFFDAPPMDERVRRELGIGEHYVLHSGGAAKRKNLDALAEAWPPGQPVEAGTSARPEWPRASSPNLALRRDAGHRPSRTGSGPSCAGSRRGFAGCGRPLAVRRLWSSRVGGDGGERSGRRCPHQQPA